MEILNQFPIRTQLFINGAFVDPIKGGKFPSYNPATNEVIMEVAAGTKEDIEVAVAAAKATFHSEKWGVKSTGAQRAAILRKIGEILVERKDWFAALDTYDMGKPMREALADLGDAITACEHFANLAEEQDKHQNEVIENGTNGDFKTEILYEPLGIIGAITPWNYPFLMGIWKVIPAIAAGCCMVLKPSELAPLSCLALGDVVNQAGLPAGALNIISGYGVDAGAPLAEHDDIDKVAFTGSIPTAKKIMLGAAMGPRAISLELGGKSPLVVFDDADVDATVDWIITGICWGSGQVCSATSRVLLQKGIKESVLARLRERLDGIKIGNSLDAEMLAHQGPTMGPVVSKGQYDRILSYIEHGRSVENLTFFYGGDDAQSQLKVRLGEGYFIPPTVFIDVPTTSKIWNEEIFGPVLCIREFETEEEAVHIANDTIYGLAAAVFSADLPRCDRVARAIRAGVVWKNCCQPAFVQAPWGGYKKSGFGRELGRWGLEEYTGVKQVTSCASGFQWGLW
jgi:betaine-aldehyde dehydrogenase